MKIKICKKFTKINKLNKAFPDDTIVVKKCLSSCYACKHHFIANIKGKEVKAKRISTLISKLKEKTD